MSDPYLDEMMRRAKAKRDAIALTPPEAEKLARTLRGLLQIERTTLDGVRDGIMMLCDHILSGSMKREIENAALRHAAYIALNTFKPAHTYASENANKYTAQDEAAVAISKRICALIEGERGMRAKQTPGPWTVRGPNPKTTNPNMGYWSVEGITNVANDCTYADACLIVIIHELLCCLEDVVTISDRKHKAWDKAHAVITKARDRSE